MDNLYNLARRDSKRISPGISRKMVNILKKGFKVNVYWFSDKGEYFDGYYISEGSRKKPGIYIKKNCTGNEILHTFFHELGHHYCMKKGLWKAYHTITRKNGRLFYTPEQARAILRTAFRAEKWVDTWAISNIKELFPNLKVSLRYNDSIRNWFHENHLCFFKRYL